MYFIFYKMKVPWIVSLHAFICFMYFMQTLGWCWTEVFLEQITSL